MLSRTFSRAAVTVSGLVVWGWPLSASAHTNQLAAPSYGWTYEPWPVALLLVLLFAYGWGVRRLWGRAGTGHGIGPGAVAGFLAGWLLLAAALLSPIHRLGAALFWVHMVQHLALLVLAPPLLTLGRPFTVIFGGLPHRARRFLARRWLTRPGWRTVRSLSGHPAAAGAVYAAAIWFWHAPRLYDAALFNTWVHEAQHAVFLLAALLFWHAVLDPVSRRRPAGSEGALLLFLTSLHGSALGMLIAFAPRPLYRAYGQRLSASTWTPLEDQQIAGMVMWMPAGAVLAGAALALFATHLRRLAARVDRADALRRSPAEEG